MSDMRRIASVTILIAVLACTNARGPSGTNCPGVQPTRLSHVPVFPGYAVKRAVRARRVLVFVHGLTGDAVGSWTAANGTYWPALIASDPALDDFDVYMYQYSTRLFGDCLPVTDIANNLRTHLKNDNVIEDHDQVIFVAHSMGGIVVRQFLLRNRDEVSDKVPISLFYGTPSGGSSKADLAHVLTTCSQVDDLRTLDVNSYLKTQQSDWLSSGFQEKIISYCAFETIPSGGSLTVTRSSATLMCNRDEPLPTNHTDAVKPGCAADLPHIVLRNAAKSLPSPIEAKLDSVGQADELRKRVADLSERLDQRRRNRAVREQLGRFLNEGDALLRLTAKGPPAPLPDREVNEWAGRVRQYLQQTLDASYDARFASPDSGFAMSYGVPKEYEALITGIKIRLAVLREFIQELHD